MNNIIYEKELNELCKNYLAHVNTINTSKFIEDHEKVVNKISEHLLYHDGVAISVYGENIPVCVLINTYGLKGLEELLEQKAIQFVLNTSIVTYNVDEIKGVNPIQSGYLSSKVHSDPEESATLGLKWLKKPLIRRDRRALIRKLIKNYYIMPPNIAQNAAEFGHEGYESNLFNELGLPNIKPLTELSLNERKSLCQLTSECMEIALLSHFNFNSFNSYNLYKLKMEETKRINKVKAIELNTNELFRIENLPNFKELLESRVIEYSDIPRIRANRNSIKFRNWIEQTTSTVDANEIAKEYIDAITNSRKASETVSGKLLKTITVTGVSAMAGTAVAGGVGTISGGFLGLCSSLGISLLDAYLLDGLLKGWNPRFFFDKEIRKLDIT